MKHLNIKIFGKVQGVFFRHYSKEKALNLGLTGFVKNMPDTSVYIEIEGDNKKVDEFLDWCKTGSNSAVVENVEVEEDSQKNFSSFEIV